MSSFVLLLFMGFILGSQSALFVERPPLILGHEDQCYDVESNVFYHKGEEMPWRGDECARRICTNSTGTPLIEIQTCPKVEVPPECYMKFDRSKPYPTCCGWIICPKQLKYTFDTDNSLD